MLEYTKYERSRTEQQLNNSIACYVVTKDGGVVWSHDQFPGIHGSEGLHLLVHSLLPLLSVGTGHCLLISQWLIVIDFIDGFVAPHFGYLLDSGSKIELRLSIMVVRVLSLA